MPLHLLALLWPPTTASAAPVIPIATFDGAATTTRPWEAINDPVMGGESWSTFTVDALRGVGVWDGEVKIVPFLHAPGFCNLESPGLHKTANFPDLSGADGLIVRLRQSLPSGLGMFNVRLTSKALGNGGQHAGKEGLYYAANFNASSEMADHFVPWSAFTCSWRGKPMECPKITTQLHAINDMGLGTYYPGSPGLFHVELESLSAGTPAQITNLQRGQLWSPTNVELATFDGGAPHKWHAENDPVMGGLSSSTFFVGEGYGDYSGSCQMVPSLGAPGFTIALTEPPLLSSFPDASSMDGLVLGLRRVGGNVSDFKAAFCDSRNFLRCQFASFKADFTLQPSINFQDIFLPWSGFSDKWSAATGKRTKEHPPGAHSLRSITQLQLWTEGVLGTFHLQLRYVLAAKAPQHLLI